MSEMQNAFIELVRVIILIGLPLCIALFVGGLLASLLQSFTVISEPVIGYSAKLLALLGTLYFMFPSFARTLTEFTIKLYGRG